MFKSILTFLLFSVTLVQLHAQNTVMSRDMDSEVQFNEAYVDSLLVKAQAVMEDERILHKALGDLELAYDIARGLNYEQGIITCCNKLGNYYLSVSDNANSTMYFYLMLKETEGLQDSVQIADAQIGLGLVMYNMSKWKDALYYLNQAEAVHLAKDSQGSGLKLAEYLKGLSLFNLKRYDEANTLLLNVNALAHQDQDSMRMFESALALNRIAIQKQVTPKEFEEFDRIQSFFERKDESIGVCYALQGRATAYLKINEPATAFKYANEALEIAHGLNLIYPISEILTTIIAAEEMRGNFVSAYNYQKELNYLKDSTNSIEVATQIAMLGASHQFEKKEAEYDAEIKSKSKQQRFFFFLFIGTLLIAVVIVFMLRLVAKQRRKSDNLLRNILPKETINELRDQGHSIPKAHKDVTIVFADVVSFTKIASTLKPHVLVQMLDRYFVRFDAIIKKYGLEKIKTIGDAYMFVSGLIPDPKSTEQAALGSLEMVDAIADMVDEMNAEFGMHFEFRFGMHTGNVVSGVVGDIKYAFDIWGDAVNIASRMENQSDAGKINISKETKLQLRNRFQFTERGSFDIKNRGNLEMYYLDRLPV